MKYAFDLKIGDRVVRIEEEVAGEHEFWQRMAFWDSLPQAGPGGEADLRFSYRTPKGYEYYALECRSAGQQFDFGQMNRTTKDLFPKGWSRIHHGLREEHEEWAGQEEPPPPPPAPPVRAPEPASAAIPWAQKHPALAGVVRDLYGVELAAKVDGQIARWASNKPIESLTPAEAEKVEKFARGWLGAIQKQRSRQGVA